MDRAVILCSNDKCLPIRCIYMTVEPDDMANKCRCKVIQHLSAIMEPFNCKDLTLSWLSWSYRCLCFVAWSALVCLSPKTPSLNKSVFQKALVWTCMGTSWRVTMFHNGQREKISNNDLVGDGWLKKVSSLAAELSEWSHPRVQALSSYA